MNLDLSFHLSDVWPTVQLCLLLLLTLVLITPFYAAAFWLVVKVGQVVIDKLDDLWEMWG